MPFRFKIYFFGIIFSVAFLTVAIGSRAEDLLSQAPNASEEQHLDRLKNTDKVIVIALTPDKDNMQARIVKVPHVSDAHVIVCFATAKVHSVDCFYVNDKTGQVAVVKTTTNMETV